MKIRTLLPVALLTGACASQSRDTNAPEPVTEAPYEEDSSRGAEDPMSTEEGVPFEPEEDLPTVKENEGPNTSVDGDPYDTEPPLSSPTGLVTPVTPGA